MEQAANRIVGYFYEQFVDEQTGEPACALVRFYKTHPYEGLTPELRAFAGSVLGHDPESPHMKCLTPMASAGARPEWNERHTSVGHQAIPLVSADMVAQSPMISQLIRQLDIEIESLLERRAPLMIDSEQQSYNVFHVPDAVGSPYIPAQEGFVIPFGVKSVLGFGGLLPSGNLFATIIFSKVPISRATAEMFKPLALSVKVAVLPFDGATIFS